MKKIFALFFILMLIVVCSSCSKQEDSSRGSDSSTTGVPATAKGSRYASAVVGDIISFGKYPQTTAGTDQTPVEWIVLDVQDGRALLLSKYGLEAKPYNTEDEDVTWETCTLRSWLNSDFLNSAFSAEEQSAIIMTEVDNSEAQACSKYRTYGGNNTQDKIFLLSFSEANRYLDVKHWSDDDENNVKARVAPTDYAIQTGASAVSYDRTVDDKEAGWWWLRSPGELPNTETDVYTTGGLGYGSVYHDNGSVRPALWLDLQSDIF